MKVSAIFMLVFSTLTAFSQTSINNYKYVLVPEKFDFSRTENQYGLNNLTKLMLEDKGFTAFVGNEGMPPEVAANKCNALKAEVTEKKGLFVTNLTLWLKDCQGNVIFKSKEGKSREKEYQLAYDEALRAAFASLKSEPYKYDGTTFQKTEQVAVVQEPAHPIPAATTPTATAPSTTPASPTVMENSGTLYAQTTSNGYQLIDTTPKKVMSLLKTSMQDYFIAEDETSKGVVFKKNGEWFFEYYKDDKLISRKLQIKF